MPRGQEAPVLIVGYRSRVYYVGMVLCPWTLFCIFQILFAILGPPISTTIMADYGFLNVFRGPNSLANFYDPDLQPPLPLLELPEYMNPFHQDGVRIFAKMMTALPAHNLKCLPGLTIALIPAQIQL
jgi:hypothetical protein